MTTRTRTTTTSQPPATSTPTTRKRVLTVAETAEALGISRSLAYELAARGDLPNLRLGKRIVVPQRAIDELLGSAVDNQG